MGGSCCSGSDTVPNNPRRNTDIQPIKQPLLTNDDIKIKEIEIEINKSIIIQHIIGLGTFKFMAIWDKIDPNGLDEIDLNTDDLSKLFLIFVDDYIKINTKKNQKINELKYDKIKQNVSNELMAYFEDTIMVNYNMQNINILTKEDYTDNFQAYFSEPNGPPIDDQAQPDIAKQSDTSHSRASTDDDTFDMLAFISTSPTIPEDPDFDVDHSVNMLKSAQKAAKKKRGEQIGEILSTLTERQRILVKDNYSGSDGESLPSALEEHFSGDLLSVLTELCHSNAYNDAGWIEKSRNKLNVNTSVINEILISRTNKQLKNIKKQYEIRFGKSLLDSLLKSFSNTASYAQLLKLILTDNDVKLRREFNPRHLKEKKIKDDAKILYHILENTKGKLNKLKVIEMLCHRSWFHIASLCREYGKKSKYDIKTMIEKKFGKNSKSGDALQKMIDVSRNRHNFFAQLLYQSMKGMGVDDGLLIRIIVGRSDIDLGEIANEFSSKYGNGKTLLQFIKANARKGTYRNILLRICAIGRGNIIDHSDNDDNDEKVMDPSVMKYSSSISSVDDIDQKAFDLPTKSWEEYISSAPTITPRIGFKANDIAKQLVDVLANKKKKKNAKKLLINTLCGISNKQRQELKRSFVEYHASKQELGAATQETLRKGKTMIVMLGLLQKPSEFNSFWIKQAIKTRKIELLIEILVGCTNYEISKMKDLYEKSEKSSLISDIEKSILGSKTTAKYLISQILDGKRPETITYDKKLCKVHLTEMSRLLKSKDAKKCKKFFAELFVNNSYTQIKYEINRFNQQSDHTLSSVVKKIMGSGYSGVIIDNIINISINRYAFYCDKLKQSMKGLSVQEQLLIRTLISRAEKDLGDIVQYFAEENYGEGKTLKQWIMDKLKGSFRTSLLKIAGVSDQHDADDDDGAQSQSEDYESQTESDFSEPLNQRSQSMAVGMSKSAAVPARAPRTKSPPPAAVPVHNSNDNKVVSKSQTSHVVVSPKDKDKDKSNDDDNYDPYDINEDELGKFIVGKVNKKTAERLMLHLQQTTPKDDDNDNIDDDNDDNLYITNAQCIHVLLFACVLYLKYKEKTENRAAIQIDKQLLKEALIPSYNWCLENKLNHQKLKKEDYKQLGKWLQQYYNTK